MEVLCSNKHHYDTHGRGLMVAQPPPTSSPNFLIVCKYKDTILALSLPIKC